MGSVLSFVKSLVFWVGGLIARVILWFTGDIKKDVESKTEDFLIKKEDKIKQADEPKQVAKIAAEQKELLLLQERLNEQKRRLSLNDRNEINKLFEEEEDPDFMQEEKEEEED